MPIFTETNVKFAEHRSDFIVENISQKNFEQYARDLEKIVDTMYAQILKYRECFRIEPTMSGPRYGGSIGSRAIEALTADGILPKRD